MKSRKKPNAMRLSKFLSLSVAMSRNQAKFFIRKGRVSVGGNVIVDPNFELSDTSHVIFDGKPISITTHQYVLLHKPASYVCAANDTEYTSVLKLLKSRSEDRYYYFANVLAPESTGIVLLSDDARWTSRMKRKLLKKPCVYQARSKKIVSEDQLRQIREVWSAPLENQTSSIVDIQQQDEKTLLLSTTQTRLKEIMDIFSSLDLVIESLKLQQLGRLSLGDLIEGGYLELTENEIKV